MGSGGLGPRRGCGPVEHGRPGESDRLLVDAHAAARITSSVMSTIQSEQPASPSRTLCLGDALVDLICERPIQRLAEAESFATAFRRGRCERRGVCRARRCPRRTRGRRGCRRLGPLAAQPARGRGRRRVAVRADRGSPDAARGRRGGGRRGAALSRLRRGDRDEHRRMRSAAGSSRPSSTRRRCSSAPTRSSAPMNAS